MTPADYSRIRRFWGNKHPLEKFAYDSNNRVLYHGIAPRGSATSDPVWIVETFLYNSQSLVSDIQASPENSVYDNRTTLTYA